MHLTLRRLLQTAFCVLGLTTFAQAETTYPNQEEHEWVIPNYRFTSGETLPELRLHYTTLGNPDGEPVLILHGTTGSARSMLKKGFADELFSTGAPLDAAQYRIILPDSIGTGKSSKPSDGLRMKFPRYTYDDMVDAQYRLITEHLGIKHLRLVLGNSMGGMHTWLWATRYPDMMDIAVPMASYPTEMAGRNWMMRRLLVDAIKSDPSWQNGDYREQPQNFRRTYLFFTTATNGGEQALYKAGSSSAAGDAWLQERLAAPFNGDANDFIYQWESSHDYNASAHLENIRAHLLAINSADDERNPRVLGIMEREIPRIPHGREYLIPASENTRGHGTVMQAKHWKAELQQLLQTAPKQQP